MAVVEEATMVDSVLVRHGQTAGPATRGGEQRTLAASLLPVDARLPVQVSRRQRVALRLLLLLGASSQKLVGQGGLHLRQVLRVAVPLQAATVVAVVGAQRVLMV